MGGGEQLYQSLCQRRREVRIRKTNIVFRGKQDQSLQHISITGQNLLHWVLKCHSETRIISKHNSEMLIDK